MDYWSPISASVGWNFSEKIILKFWLSCTIEFQTLTSLWASNRTPRRVPRKVSECQTVSRLLPTSNELKKWANEVAKERPHWTSLDSVKKRWLIDLVNQIYSSGSSRECSSGPMDRIKYTKTSNSLNYVNSSSWWLQQIESFKSKVSRNSISFRSVHQICSSD